MYFYRWTNGNAGQKSYKIDTSILVLSLRVRREMEKTANAKVKAKMDICIKSDNQTPTIRNESPMDLVSSEFTIIAAEMKDARSVAVIPPTYLGTLHAQLLGNARNCRLLSPHRPAVSLAIVHARDNIPR